MGRALYTAEPRFNPWYSMVPQGVVQNIQRKKTDTVKYDQSLMGSTKYLQETVSDSALGNQDMLHKRDDLISLKMRDFQ